MSQRRLVTLLGVVIVGAIAFSFLRGTFVGNPTSAPAAQPGSQAVYQRIASTSDCATLQAEFDQAYADHQSAPAGSTGKAWTLGYMEAAQARMTAVGCP